MAKHLCDMRDALNAWCIRYRADVLLAAAWIFVSVGCVEAARSELDGPRSANRDDVVARSDIGCDGHGC